MIKNYNLTFEEFDGLKILLNRMVDYSDIYIIESLMKYSELSYIVNYYNEQQYQKKINGDIEYTCSILISSDIINPYLKEIIRKKKINKINE